MPWNLIWGVEIAFFENENLRLSQNIKAVMKVITDYFFMAKINFEMPIEIK